MVYIIWATWIKLYMVDMLMIMSFECRLLSSAFCECHFSDMKMSLSCQY